MIPFDPRIDPPVLWLGIVCAVACAVPGTFLVVRRLSMTSEAISHAALPGVVLAFLLTGSKEPQWMLLGAAAVGLVTTSLIHWVQRFGRLESGASMGVVFTTLFALGLLLVRRHTDNVCIEPHVVLFGNLDLAPFGRAVTWFGASIPQPTATLSILAVLNLVLAGLTFKEQEISAFDPAHAHTQGIRGGWVRHSLLVVTTITTVAAFEAVGVILVVAMTIVPAATALLVARSLRQALVFSIAIAVVGVVLGRWLSLVAPGAIARALAGSSAAQVEDTHTAGVVAVVYSLGFLLTLVWTGWRPDSAVAG